MQKKIFFTLVIILVFYLKCDREDNLSKFYTQENCEKIDFTNSKVIDAKINFFDFNYTKYNLKDFAYLRFDKIIENKNQLYLYDRKTTKSLYIIDKRKQILHKVLGLYGDSLQRHRISDFTLNYNGNGILTFKTPNILFSYDSLGNYINKKEYPFEFVNWLSISENKLIFYLNFNRNGVPKNKLLSYNIVIYDNDKLHFTLPYLKSIDYRNIALNHNYTFSRNFDNIYFNQFGNCIYYKVEKNTIIPKYFIELNDSINEQQNTFIKEKKIKALDFFEQDHLSDIFYEETNYILFSYVKHKKYYFGIYDKDGKKSYSFQRFSLDFNNKISIMPKHISNGNMYIILNSDLFNLFKINKNSIFQNGEVCKDNEVIILKIKLPKKMDFSKF